MRVLWLIMLFLLGIARVNADTLYIAAASNLVYCLEALNTQFTQQNPQLNLKVVTGSSGNLFAQIQQNAPFEVFLSADVLHPQQLVQQQQADANSLAIYSKGQIALWTNNPTIDLKKRLIGVVATQYQTYCHCQPTTRTLWPSRASRFTKATALAANTKQISVRRKHFANLTVCTNR